MPGSCAQRTSLRGASVTGSPDACEDVGRMALGSVDVSDGGSKSPSRPPRQCLVLVSGGIDSAACVRFYQRQQFAVRGLHITYGQPAAHQEATAARAVRDHYGIPLAHLRVLGAGLKPAGQILGRNAFLLFTALSELGACSAMIALGVHSGTPYYDCTARFISAVQTIVDGQCDGRIRVAAPFLEWTKRQIWDYCVEQQVPIERTYSCEKGQVRPCGVCLSCRDREDLLACQKLHNTA